MHSSTWTTRYNTTDDSSSRFQPLHKNKKLYQSFIICSSVIEWSAVKWILILIKKQKCTEQNVNVLKRCQVGIENNVFENWSLKYKSSTITIWANIFKFCFSIAFSTNPLFNLFYLITSISMFIELKFIQLKSSELLAVWNAQAEF